MSAATALPFAPLTHDELNKRTAAALKRAGHIAANAVRRQGGEFDAYDLDRIRQAGRDAVDYLDAALARCPR